MHECPMLHIEVAYKDSIQVGRAGSRGPCMLGPIGMKLVFRLMTQPILQLYLVS